MTECIHGLLEEQCDVCSSPEREGSRGGTTSGLMANKRFALVLAPSIRADTFLHLNREGETWKIRWYASPDAPAIEVAGSGVTSVFGNDLASLEITERISYPYSMSADGVAVTDTRYWFDEIASANAKRGIGPRSAGAF